MLDMLMRNWWVYLVRGLLAVIFGVLALAWPPVTIVALTMLFGAFALLDGVFAIVAGINRSGDDGRRWVMILQGIAGIIVGVVTFLWPAMTSLILLYLIAAWALVTGLFDIVAAIQLRHVLEDEWRLALSGVLSVVLGVLLSVFPGAGALGLVWSIGILAIAIGVALIVFAFRLRQLHGKPRDFRPGHGLP